MAAADENNYDLTEHVDHHLLILSQLHNQRSEGKYCDLILTLFGYSVAVHSCVLAAFSPYIDNILSNRRDKLTEKPEETIEIHLNGQKHKNIRSYSRALNIVLDYIYTGKLVLNESTWINVKTIAEEMQLNQVVRECDKFQSKTKPRNRSLKATNSFNVRKSKFKSKIDETGCLIASLAQRPNKITPSKVGKEPSENEEVKSCSDVVSDNLTSWKNFRCSKCVYVAKTSRQLKAHHQTHVRKCHSCCSCGFVAGNIKELISHLIEKKHDETVCSVCAYQTDSIEDLTEHIHQHDDRKPFFCFSCDSRFLTYTALSLHLPKHSNQKPFACNICNKRFKWKHVLQNHNIVHSQEKQHLCDQCGFRTAHQSTFKAHCLLHTGNTFKCSHPDCTFQTLRKQNLQQHLQTHRKEKPYQCEVCGQAFSLVKNLRRHARMHNSSGSTLACSKCLFTTTRIDKLKDHLRKHHLSTKNNKQNIKTTVTNSEISGSESPENGENVDNVLKLKPPSISLGGESSLNVQIHTIADSDNQYLTYSTIPVTQIMPIYTLTTLSTDAE